MHREFDRIGVLDYVADPQLGVGTQAVALHPNPARSGRPPKRRTAAGRALSPRPGGRVLPRREYGIAIADGPEPVLRKVEAER